MMSAVKTLAVALAAVAFLNLAADEGRKEATAVQTIDGHGSVRAFPNGKEQPRDGSRIVVDLTTGGPRNAVNKGVEKLARFVNIYAAAGKSPARAKIVVVLHGDATEVVLNDPAYASAFTTKTNPNLPLIRKLRQAEVEFLVCGQSLASKGYQPAQTAPEVPVAVSALTALANHQHDGCAYISVR